MFKKILCLMLIFIMLFCNFSFAAKEPKLIRTINSGLLQIKQWIIKIATPAAAVAIGSGVLMKKFSFGDEERILTRKKTYKKHLVFLYIYSLC